MIPIKQLMTPSPLTIDPNATLKEAISLMETHGFRHLPVVAQAKLVGLVTLQGLHAAAPGHLHSVMTVKKALKTKPYAISADTPADDVMRTMAEKKLESAVIIDPKGRPIGIVTITDILNALSDCVK